MYELCCDMIDLLINMSEIYGQPNEDNIRKIDDEEEDDEISDDIESVNEGLENIDGDDSRGQREWDLQSQSNSGIQINGSENEPPLSSKLLNFP